MFPSLRRIPWPKRLDSDSPRIRSWPSRRCAQRDRQQGLKSGNARAWCAAHSRHAHQSPQPALHVNPDWHTPAAHVAVALAVLAHCVPHEPQVLAALSTLV